VKSSAVVFLASFVAASLSWAGFVLAPQIQLGNLAPANPTGSDSLYPSARPGLAAQGAEVYRSLGCVYCHTQQVRQEATRVDVMLNEIGTNRTKVETIVAGLNPGADRVGPLQPGKIAEMADVPTAEPLASQLREVGAKVGLRVVALGPDIERGWGIRQSVAQDYLYDQPVQIGSRRSGPDLANIGAGKPAEWQLRHLYQPTSVVTNSTMPPYPFLFQTRKVSGARSPDALNLARELVVLPKDAEPNEEYEVVPTEAARLLIAYLQSLRVSVPLYEAPVTVAQAAPVANSTNTPAK
jgi:cbb3-type cytochrome oxidase cytochrome c subunit